MFLDVMAVYANVPQDLIDAVECEVNIYDAQGYTVIDRDALEDVSPEYREALKPYELTQKTLF